MHAHACDLVRETIHVTSDYCCVYAFSLMNKPMLLRFTPITMQHPEVLWVARQIRYNCIGCSPNPYRSKIAKWEYIHKCIILHIYIAIHYSYIACLNRGKVILLDHARPKLYSLVGLMVLDSYMNIYTAISCSFKYVLLYF